MKKIKGDLILEKDTIFEEDLKVEGNIIGKEGDKYNLTVKGNINCRDIDCGNINCLDINCGDIDCGNINCEDIDCVDINCRNIDCWNINCWNIDCWNINFYAICIAYKTFKCKSWKAKRDNFICKCLDGEIEIKEEKKFCDKCGSELK